MTITLTFAWWWIPAAITAAAFLWMLIASRDDGTDFGIGIDAAIDAAMAAQPTGDTK